ncbi:MAG: hypothetical protein R6V15_04010 [Desulfotignum sp.]
MKRICIPGIFVSGLIVLMGVCMTGCSGIIRDFPEQNQFTISPPLLPGEAGIRGSGKGLLVRQFDISPEFESNFFIYKVSDNRYTGDYYNKFMVSPARMISDAFKEAVYSSAIFRDAPASSPSDISFRLGGKIISLYADIRDPKKPRAVMALRLTLEQHTGTGFVPVINRIYGVSQFTAQSGPTALVQAWNRCLARIISDFLKDAETLN